MQIFYINIYKSVFNVTGMMSTYCQNVYFIRIACDKQKKQEYLESLGETKPVHHVSRA